MRRPGLSSSDSEIFASFDFEPGSMALLNEVWKATILATRLPAHKSQDK